MKYETAAWKIKWKKMHRMIVAKNNEISACDNGVSKEIIS